MDKYEDNINWAVILAIVSVITGGLIASFENSLNIFIVGLELGIIFLFFGIIKEFLEENEI